MSQPFLGQIQAFPFTFAPRGWALCNGQLLPISQNQALFSLLGTQYGGNGTQTFALPNLQGSFSVGLSTTSSNFSAIGATGGESSHTLTATELPAHTHTPVGTSAAPTTGSPISTFPAALANAYQTGAPDTPATLGSGTTAGTSTPHENRPPFLALNFCIALQGVFPSRN
jgi:microcystin-dependent protein